MWCRNASKQLSALVDGELLPAQELAVRSHVDQCPRCAQELAALQGVVRLSRSIPMEAVPADLYTRTLTRLAYAHTMPVAVVPVRRRRAATPFWLIPGMAGAATCAAVLLLAQTAPHGARQNQPAQSFPTPTATAQAEAAPTPEVARKEQPSRSVTVRTPQPRVALAAPTASTADVESVARPAEVSHPASIVPAATQVKNVTHPRRPSLHVAPPDRHVAEGRGLPSPIGAGEVQDEDFQPDQPERDAAPPSVVMAEVPTPTPTGDASPADTSDAVMVGMERDNGMRMAGFTPDSDNAPGDDEGLQMLRMYLSERNRSVPQPPALGMGRRNRLPKPL